MRRFATDKMCDLFHIAQELRTLMVGWMYIFTIIGISVNTPDLINRYVFLSQRLMVPYKLLFYMRMENYYLFHFLRQKKLNLNSLFCSDITTTLNAIWQKIVCPWKSAELTFFVRRWTYLTGDGNSNFPIEREERHVCTTIV